MPGGGFVTNEIKLPENWNELVAPLGYEPIEHFYISGKFNVDWKSQDALKHRLIGGFMKKIFL